MAVNYRLFCGICVLIIAVLVVKDVFFGYAAITGQSTAETALALKDQQIGVKDAQIKVLQQTQRDLSSCMARVATCEDGREAQKEAKQLREEHTALTTFLKTYTAAANTVKQDVVVLNGIVDTWTLTANKIRPDPEALISLKADYESALARLEQDTASYLAIVSENQESINEFGGLVLIPEDQLTRRISEAKDDLKKFDYTLRTLEY